MSPRTLRLGLGWVLWGVTVGLAIGAETPPANLVRTTGVVAIQRNAAEPWRVLNQGDPLPSTCQLRSGFLGASLFQLPGAQLQVDTETQLQFDGAARQVVLQRGQILLTTEAGKTWSAKTGTILASLDPQSTAEIAAPAGEPIVVHVTQGNVRLEMAGGQPLSVAAGFTATWKPGDKQPSTTKLSDAEQKRIEAWTASGHAQGLGQLLITDAQSGSPRRLDVARYHVHVVLQPPVALVQIDQAFYNPSNGQEEGTFVFNLPRGASVSRFAMYVTRDELVEGELIERQKAVNVYESIVRSRRDPALLEQIGDNLFRMRVFPIPARDVKRILLDYTIPLEAEEGAYQFQLPLFSDLNPIADFRLTGAIKGPTRLESVASPSHPELKVGRPEANQVAFRLEQRNYRPESDFLLEFVQPGGDRPEFRTYQASAPPQTVAWQRREWDDAWASTAATYFLASIPPRPEDVPDTSAADVLILADTSIGLRHNKLVPKALRTVLHNLRPCDRFQLACIDVGVRPLTDGWLTPDRAACEAALARFDQEYCLGGADLVASFREAVQRFDPKSPKRRRVCLYLGDGDDTLTTLSAERLDQTLADLLRQANASLFSAIVRMDPKGTPLLEALARRTGGQVFNLTGPSGQRELFGWVLNLRQPMRIVSAEAYGVAAEDLFYSTAWAAGRPLVVYGRVPQTDRVQLSLTVERNGHPERQQWEFHCRDEDDDVFVGRLWAQKKLDQLRAQATEPNPPENVRGPIVALSQEWSLLSPYTAFLVLEGEADYRRWDIARQLRRQYWRPAEALPQTPLPADWVALKQPTPLEWRRKADATQYAEAMASARKAIAAKNGVLAHSLLERIKTNPHATGPEYVELRRQAESIARTQRLVEQLGLHRALLDPASRTGRVQIEPSLNLFLLGDSSGNPTFVRRHPYYRPLLKEIPVEPRGQGGRFTLQDFRDELRNMTGANVVLDFRALDDVGIGADAPVEIYGWGKMSLRNYTRLILHQLDLTLIEEPHRLLITTPEVAETRLTTEVYPVAGLYSTTGPHDLSLLSDPYFDHDEAAQQRIRSKLQRSSSFGLREKPFQQVLTQFANTLSDTVVVDERALSDIGMDLDTPVSVSLDNVPLKDALQWTLEQLDLTYYLEGDALVITTPEEAECHLQTRLHSLRGVAYEWTSPFNSQFARFMGRSGGGFGGGFGGMGGGMGAMGGGMFGGGFGGMGAMGGSGGGDFRGTFGGGGGGWSSEQAGLSSVDGLDTEPSAAPVSDGVPSAWAGPWSADLTRRAGFMEPFESPGEWNQRSEADFDSSIELITSTIRPTTWDDVGGPGSIAPFEPTLDLVASATMETHDEIEEYLHRLRELPVVNKQSGARLAQPPTTEADMVYDLNGLADLIQTTVYPTTWDEVGGPGSIATDEPRMALVFSQTQEVHDAVAQLLCMLHRSRYEVLYGLRPWEAAGAAAPMLSCLGINNEAAQLRLTKLPEPNANELAALGVRRQPTGGVWKWRYYPAGSEQPQVITLRKSGPRMEIELDEVILRMEDDAVAAAYPGLRLVEHSNWAEAVRQTADSWLPWLPHRSNEQLVRLFDIKPAASPSASEDVCLRLIPSGQPETAGTWLTATFARKDGQLRAWESHLNGKLTGRLRFVDPAGSSGVWRTVVLEDAAGKTLARWELIESSEKAAEIPALTAGWDGYVQMDRRWREAAIDPAFRRALEATQKSNWARAMDEIRLANKVHPRHPLLLFLNALCVHHDERFGTRADVVRLLEEVAASRATLLTRFVVDHFRWLTSEERCGILRQMPHEARQPRDWDRLAEAAMEASQWEEALASTEIVLGLGRAEATFECHRRHVELLLRLGRGEAAATAARQWATQNTATPQQLAAIAELLTRYGAHGCASELFDRALAAKLSVEERCDLLRRRADLVEGLPRWKLLLEAATLQPLGSAHRAACVTSVCNELGFAQFELASQLVEQVQASDLRTALRVRQAELAPDGATTAELLWEVRSSKWFSEEHYQWACRLWNDQRKPDRVVEMAEARLRSGVELSLPVQAELARAYRLLARPRDARRVETSDLLLNQPWP